MMQIFVITLLSASVRLLDVLPRATGFQVHGLEI